MSLCNYCGAEDEGIDIDIAIVCSECNTARIDNNLAATKEKE